MGDDFLVTIAVGRRSAVPVLRAAFSASSSARMSSTARSTRRWFSAIVHPAAHARRVRERNSHRLAVVEGLPDARVEARKAEQPTDREPAHGDDQPRLQQPELPFAPERAELLLRRGRRPIAAACRATPRIAPRDRGAVERRVEVVLVEPEPAAQRLAGATSPWPKLLALDHARCLSEEIRALPRIALDHRTRLDRKPSLGARTARPVVTLERGERPVRRPPPRHPRERTTTNQFPSKRTSPSPSSSASSDATK